MLHDDREPALTVRWPMVFTMAGRGRLHAPFKIRYFQKGGPSFAVTWAVLSVAIGDPGARALGRRCSLRRRICLTSDLCFTNRFFKLNGFKGVF
jgi:hypothetical protein